MHIKQQQQKKKCIGLINKGSGRKRQKFQINHFESKLKKNHPNRGNISLDTLISGFVQSYTETLSISFRKIHSLFYIFHCETSLIMTFVSYHYKSWINSNLIYDINNWIEHTLFKSQNPSIQSKQPKQVLFLIKCHLTRLNILSMLYGTHSFSHLNFLSTL